MFNIIKFYKDESGAVTVDWVVLTAAIVGIAIAVITLISGGVEDASTGINDELIVASNFTFGGSDSNWAGDYVPISSQHGTSWGTDGLNADGQTWAEDTYSNWSEMDDATLVAQHQFNLDGLAGGGNDDLYTDYIAVSGEILTERGIN